MTTKNDKKTTASSNSNKGFASMDPEKQHEIASKGGKASHKNGGSGSKSSTTKSK